MRSKSSTACLRARVSNPRHDVELPVLVDRPRSRLEGADLHLRGGVRFHRRCGRAADRTPTGAAPSRFGAGWRRDLGNLRSLPMDPSPRHASRTEPNTSRSRPAPGGDSATPRTRRQYCWRTQPKTKGREMLRAWRAVCGNLGAQCGLTAIRRGSGLAPTVRAAGAPSIMMRQIPPARCHPRRSAHHSAATVAVFSDLAQAKGRRCPVDHPADWFRDRRCCRPGSGSPRPRHIASSDGLAPANASK